MNIFDLAVPPFQETAILLSFVQNPQQVLNPNELAQGINPHLILTHCFHMMFAKSWLLIYEKL